MVSPAPTSATQRVIQSIRSDQLPQLTTILAKLAPAFGAELLQVTFVLDANVVLQDLRWLAQRQNPEAKTRVMELLACQVVKGYAPTYLKTEVKRKIPVIAKRYKIDPDVMRREWERYQLLITFLEAGGARKRRNLADAKDTPYLRVREQLDAVIATDDHHIHDATPRAVRLNIFPHLQQYARDSAIEFQLKAHAVGTAMALGLLFEGVLHAARGVTRLPRPLLFLVLMLIGVAVLHPTSRRKITENLDSILALLGCALEQIYLATEPFINEHDNAKRAARDSRSTIEQMISSTQDCKGSGLPASALH